MKDRIEAADRTVTNAIATTFAGTGVAIFLVFLTSALISGDIARRLAYVVQGTKALARGDLSKRIEVESKDEIGQLGQAFNTMAAAMASAETQLAQASEKLLSIQDEERRRIAQELHDETGSALTALIVNLQNLAETDSRDRAKIQIEKIQRDAARTLEDVRRIALGLHPIVLERFGLAQAVKQYVRSFASRHDIKTQVRVGDLPEHLPNDVSTALYRILQEALTNVAKHADAESVSVIIDRRDGNIVLVVEDDGKGFDEERANSSESTGLGLQGIIERVALLHGTVEFEPTPGSGTTLYVIIPDMAGRKQHAA